MLILCLGILASAAIVRGQHIVVEDLGMLRNRAEPNSTEFQLFRFHPFPLVLNDIALVPKLEFDTLAVADNWESEETSSFQFNSENLAGFWNCNYFICNRSSNVSSCFRISFNGP